eukprot:TRINITY_DN5570_c0_g1_i1.p1 TRINITY_DN5570_c0_g1~~TRINITY_DN5570_c0_g1_i1.p1  ORF type:complete len:660 (+),score=150.53 TRINITY_DN5570_c0_g1_i1:260-1981(+)
MRKDIKKIEMNNEHLIVGRRNYQALVLEIEPLLNALDIDKPKIDALEKVDFLPGTNVSKSINAVVSFQKSYPHDVPTQFNDMEAIVKQKAEFERVRDNLATKIEKFFREFFSLIVEIVFDKNMLSVHDLEHSQTHSSIQHYKALFFWIKEMIPLRMSVVFRNYIGVSNLNYKKEIKSFFTILRNFFPKDAPKDNKILGGKKSSVLEYRTDSSLFANDLKISERTSFFKLILFEIAAFTRCLNTEHEFIMTLFDVKDNELLLGFSLDAIIDDLLGTSLKPEIQNLIEIADKSDHFIMLAVMCDLEKVEYQSQKLQQTAKDFLRYVYNLASDRFTQSLDEELAGFEVQGSSLLGSSSGGKSGLHSSVASLPIFVNKMEIFRPELSAVVDSTYAKVFPKIFQFIGRLSENDEKHKHSHRTENYFFISKELAGKNFNGITPYVEEARSLYNTSLNNFCFFTSRKHFKTILDYFESIDQLLLKLSPEDIPFQNAHSNAAFIKLLAEYPLPKLEKKIASTQKRVSRSFSSNPELQELALVAYKEFLVNKWKHYEQVVEKCYKNQKLLPNQQISDLFKAK